VSYYGIHQKGDEVYVPVATLSGEGLLLEPDNPPLCLVFNPAGVLEKQFTIPKAGSGADSWHFSMEYFLGKTFNAGKYTVIFAYDDNPDYYITAAYFDVYETGDSHGNPISMTAIGFENVKYVVSQLTSGAIIRGRVYE
jgi:hypothetical protein